MWLILGGNEGCTALQMADLDLSDMGWAQPASFFVSLPLAISMFLSLCLCLSVSLSLFLVSLIFLPLSLLVSLLSHLS